MGSVLFCPRARCPPKVGSPSIRLYGLLLGPTSPAHLGCQYRPHVDSPDGLRVILSARSMSAPSGQPIDPYILAPSRSHLSSPFGLPIWAPRRQPRWALLFCPRARCPPQVGSPSIRIYGLLLGPTSPAHLGCQYGPHVDSPDGLRVILSARSMSAQSGHPIDPYIWAPSRSHLPSSFGLPIWAPRRQPRWARCSFSVRSMSVLSGQPISVYMGSF